MRVVVTGAAGFIGSRLSHALLASAGFLGRDISRLVLLDRVVSPSTDPRVVAVVGDFGDRHVRQQALGEGADVVFHLAAVPGAAAERDPDLSRRVNVEATLALADDVAAVGGILVYASTIAVLGQPTGPVDDDTVASPTVVYGRDKHNVEGTLASRSRDRGAKISSLRLPGIVARPAGDTGLKSAFMSDIFHALHQRRFYTCPVSADASVWLMSVRCCVENLLRGPAPETIDVLAGDAVTLPALHITIGELITTAASAFDADAGLIAFEPDPKLEAAFGCLPTLTTTRADQAGFHHDGDLVTLVAAVKRDLLLGQVAASG